MDTDSKRGKLILGGGLLITAAIFFARETAAWILGQVLGFLFRLPKNAQGEPDLGALPWAEIAGTVVAVAGLFFIWRGLRQKPDSAGGANPHESINARVQGEVRKIRATVNQVDERVAALMARVEEMAPSANLARVAARRDYLGNLINRVDGLHQEMREAFERFFEAAKEKRGPPPAIQSLKPYEEKIDAARRRLGELLDGYAGQPISLGQHPTYSLNPMKPVGKDKDVPDPEWRQEYRRVWDQMLCDKHAIGMVVKHMQREYNALTGAWVGGGK